MSVSWVKVGIGLMILQQFSGINAIMLYANKIFSTAGKLLNLESEMFENLMMGASFVTLYEVLQLKNLTTASLRHGIGVSNPDVASVTLGTIQPILLHTENK
jgi:hypothetical protein